MAEIKPTKPTKPYDPREGAAVNIQIDLDDLCKKTVKHGALYVLGEALLNLCLIKNDHDSGGKFKSPDYAKSKKKGK